MKDHLIAAKVNELRDIAKLYHNTGQLRSRIHGAIVPTLNIAKAADAAIHAAEGMRASNCCNDPECFLCDDARAFDTAMLAYRALVPCTKD